MTPWLGGDASPPNPFYHGAPFGASVCLNLFGAAPFGIAPACSEDRPICPLAGFQSPCRLPISKPCRPAPPHLPADWPRGRSGFHGLDQHPQVELQFLPSARSSGRDLRLRPDARTGRAGEFSERLPGAVAGRRLCCVRQLLHQTGTRNGGGWMLGACAAPLLEPIHISWVVVCGNPHWLRGDPLSPRGCDQKPTTLFSPTPWIHTGVPNAGGAGAFYVDPNYFCFVVQTFDYTAGELFPGTKRFSLPVRPLHRHPGKPHHE